jgi:hypothetical protein
VYLYLVATITPIGKPKNWHNIIDGVNNISIPFTIILVGKLEIANHLYHDLFLNNHQVYLLEIHEPQLFRPTFLYIILGPIKPMFTNIELNLLQ